MPESAVNDVSCLRFQTGVSRGKLSDDPHMINLLFLEDISDAGNFSPVCSGDPDSTVVYIAGYEMCVFVDPEHFR